MRGTSRAALGSFAGTTVLFAATFPAGLVRAAFAHDNPPEQLTYRVPAYPMALDTDVPDEEKVVMGTPTFTSATCVPATIRTRIVQRARSTTKVHHVSLSRSAFFSIACMVLLALADLSTTRPAVADDTLARSFGGTVYVPTFSRLPRSATAFDPLSSTLVVHNVDPEASITLASVQYFDSAGVAVVDLLEDPVVLAPFQSSDFFVDRDQEAGGTGNNFLVRWTSDVSAVEPLMIALMHGGSGTQGLSFTTFGRVIERRSSATD